MITTMNLLCFDEDEKQQVLERFAHLEGLKLSVADERKARKKARKSHRFWQVPVQFPQAKLPSRLPNMTAVGTSPVNGTTNTGAGAAVASGKLSISAAISGTGFKDAIFTVFRHCTKSSSDKYWYWSSSH